jgi:cytochrome P450
MTTVAVRAGLPPGPKWPRVAQTLYFAQRELDLLDRCSAAYGDRFTLRLLDYGELVVISSPEDFKAVFTASTDVLRAGESWGNHMYEPIVGSNSILTLDGDEHITRRRRMLPAFRSERIANYEQLIEDVTVAEMETWPAGTPFALHPRMANITLRVILRAVFGFEHDEVIPKFERLVTRMLHVGGIVTTAPVLHPDLGPLSARRRLARRRHAVDQALLAEIERRRRSTNGDRDVLSLLLGARDEGLIPDDGQMLDELVNVLMAGHDTTAAELAWAFERLTHNPETMRRLREDLEAGDDDVYLDATIKETLRQRPVFNFAMRHVRRPFELGDLELGAGTTIGLSIYLNHHRPDLHPDPRRFDPERFVDGAPDTYRWVAFGGGSRRCLGAPFASLELRTVLRTVLTRVTLRAAEPEAEKPKRHAITSVPGKGAMVVMERRS